MRTSRFVFLLGTCALLACTADKGAESSYDPENPDDGEDPGASGDGTGGVDPDAPGTAGGGNATGSGGNSGGAGGQCKKESEFDPGDISKETGGVEVEPHLVVLPNGWLASAHIAATPDGHQSIGYTFSKDGGQTREPIKLINFMGQTGADPVLAADKNDNTYLAWVSYVNPDLRNPDRRIVVAKATAGSTSFGAPVVVHEGDGADKPWIGATSSGSLVITHIMLGKRVGVASSPDGAKWNWSLFDQSQGLVQFPFVCSALGTPRVYIAYYGVGDNDQNAILRWSEDNGATWPPNNRSTISRPDAGTSQAIALDGVYCVAKGNDVWASYGVTRDPAVLQGSPPQDRSVLSAELRVAHSGNGGRSWDAPRDAHDPSAGSAFLHPTLALEPNGALDIAYYAGKGEGDGGATLRLARSTDGGATWSKSRVVHSGISLFTNRYQPAKILAEYFGLSTDGCNVFVNYVDNGSGQGHVGLFRAPVGG